MSKILKHLNKNLITTNQELYPKILLRGSILNKKRNILLDNSLYFTSLSSYNLDISQISRNVKYFNFQNVRFKPIKFSHIVDNFRPNFENLISSLNKIFYVLSFLKKEQMCIFLLTPVKSGFICFFNGLSGFMFSKALRAISLHFDINLRNLNNLTRIIFLKDSLFRPWIKLPSEIGYKVSRLVALKGKKFSKKSKIFKLANSLNVIFFVKKKD